MCQKQCRDENGFKCHCMSESHQRQMQVFGMNPNRVIGGYSEEFERSFLDHMRRSHRFSRVAATVVYNEYIADRHHVHMNSTQWATLTEFVKYLGRTGKCKVDETPKGWFITYVDRDSETIFKDRLKDKRLRSDLVEEERQERLIARQIERASAQLPSVSGSTDQNLNPSDEAKLPPSKSSERIMFSIQPTVVASSKPILAADVGGIPRGICSNLGFSEDSESEWKVKKMKSSSTNGNAGGGGESALLELMRDEEKEKERRNRKDYWLCEGILVKVMSETLADKGYYKQKGVVLKRIDKYVGEIEILKNKHVLRIDQEELETVIPQIGGLVRIVNGAYRGSFARLLSVDTDRFCANVQIEKGVYDGRVLQAVDYEDICKVLQ